MKISLVINCDTRKGFDAPTTKIGEFGEGSLQGCRSLDYLTHGVRNKRAFFEGHDLETILVIDEHEKLPDDTTRELYRMTQNGELSKLHIGKFDHSRHKWNDHLYLQSLAMAAGDYVAHIDGDVAMFRRPGAQIVANYFSLLKTYKYVCQPTKVADHGMYWASSRFFFSRRETLDLTELARCLDDAYRRTKYGDKHCPCLEAVLGVVAGEGSVIYPMTDDANYLIFSWVSYFQGLLPQLMALPYDEVRAYADKCGIHGPNDLIAQPI